MSALLCYFLILLCGGRVGSSTMSSFASPTPLVSSHRVSKTGLLDHQRGLTNDTHNSNCVKWGNTHCPSPSPPNEIYTSVLHVNTNDWPGALAGKFLKAIELWKEELFNCKETKRMVNDFIILVNTHTCQAVTSPVAVIENQLMGERFAVLLSFPRRVG